MSFNVLASRDSRKSVLLCEQADKKGMKWCGIVFAERKMTVYVLQKLLAACPCLSFLRTGASPPLFTFACLFIFHFLERSLLGLAPKLWKIVLLNENTV